MNLKKSNLYAGLNFEPSTPWSNNFLKFYFSKYLINFFQSPTQCHPGRNRPHRCACRRPSPGPTKHEHNAAKLVGQSTGPAGARARNGQPILPTTRTASGTGGCGQFGGTAASSPLDAPTHNDAPAVAGHGFGKIFGK